jgi:hypothetical protein
VLTQPLCHSRRIHAATGCQQFHQHGLNTCLTLPRCQMQNPQVLLGRPRRLSLVQHVVGHAEVAARKKILAVAIVGERPGLAHQPVDDVPVVDAMLAAATQPPKLLAQTLGVPHLYTLGV